MGVPIYSDEFKDEAVRQVLEGECSAREVAKRLGVSDKSVYTWLRERSGQSREGKKTETVEGLKDQISQLKAELRRTKEERDILKKAAAYFAKASE